MKLMIAGGSGFVGKELVAQLLKEGHSVTLLSRRARELNRQNQSKTKEQLCLQYWDGQSQGEWSALVEGMDGVVNLSGEGIANRRWSKEQKAKLVASRLQSTRALVEAVQKAKLKPHVFVNGSAVGYYGPVEEGDVTENTPKGWGFLPDLCERWENEAKGLESFDVRVVLARFGMILEKEGGALAKFLPPFYFFAGGPLGSGKQWVPWIHRTDVVRVILFALKNRALSGPVNVCAPESVRMSEFCKVLGQVLHRPSWIPVPTFVLKLLFGEMSEVMLTGQKAIPAKLKSHDFNFKYPTLAQALASILKSKS